MVSEANLTGRWEATELRVDETSGTDDEKNARDFLEFLTARECYIVTLEFNSDLTAVTENSLNYLEINVNSGGTGIDIPCPDQKDIINTTYSFDGEILTIVEEDGTTTETAITLDGDVLIINGADLNIPQLTSSTDVVFTRR